jgi:C4-type Zn-finger protein
VWKNNDAQDTAISPELVKSKKEQLEYIADLLLELKEMARGYNLSTLEGILDLARTEARLRSRDRR